MVRIYLFMSVFYHFRFQHYQYMAKINLEKRQQIKHTIHTCKRCTRSEGRKK
uniref:Uncharacterized protein n=1 Tax=Rhizophora mucronata TaxID=61149 RepID=A0A2P2PDM5_RHIMU